MDTDSTARLLYLGLLGAAVAASLFALYRGRIGQGLRDGLIWGLIVIGLVAAYGLRDEIGGALNPTGAVVSTGGDIILRRASDGHFRVDAEVNGAPVTFLVDTGASDVVLSREDAIRAGLHPDDLRFTGRAETANGMVRMAPVRLEELAFGGLQAADVPAAVSEGELFSSLLGMSYLRRFKRVTVEGDRLILTP